VILLQKLKKQKKKNTPLFLFNGYFEVDSVIDLLRSSDAHQQRKINKKDREKQRHGFKETLSALQEGKSPRITMTICGQQFVFDDWKSIKRLSIFRHLLGTGLQIHLQHNPLLSAIFNISISQKPSVQKSDKREAMALNAAGAKDRSQRIKANRNAKVKRTDGADQE